MTGVVLLVILAMAFLYAHTLRIGAHATKIGAAQIRCGEAQISNNDRVTEVLTQLQQTHETMVELAKAQASLSERQDGLQANFEALLEALRKTADGECSG